MHNTRKARVIAADARDMLGGNGILLDPRHVWIADALPKGTTGKIQKRDIVIPADLAVP